MRSHVCLSECIRLRVTITWGLAVVMAMLGTAGVAAQHPRGDAEVSLTHGVLAYLDGQYDEAANLLEEAVRLAPDRAPAHHWLGLTYRAMGREPDAQRELQTAGRLDPALAVAAGQRGPSIFAPEAALPGTAPRFSGWASFSIGSDSNPTLLSEDFIAFPPGAGAVSGETRDTMGRLDVQGQARLASGNQAWSPEIVVRATEVRYQSLDFANGSSLEGRFQIARGRTADGLVRGPLGAARVPNGNSTIAVLVQAAASRERIGGDPWANTRAAGGVVSLRTGKVGRLEGDVLLRDLDLSRDPGEPNTFGGRVATFGVRQQFYLGRADRWLRVGVATGSRDAGAAYDAGLRSLGADMSLPFGADRGSLGVSVAITREEFDKAASNPVGPRPREDELRSAAVVVAVRVVPRVFLSGRLAAIDRNTDVGPPAPGLPDLGYRRVLTTAALSWAF